MSAWMREFSNLATAYYNARRARGDFASSGTDPLSYKKKQLDVEGKFLENMQKRRELQDVSPKMKYMESQRSEQVKGALGTFAEQWKGASDASKDLLEEQMRGLHGMMTKSEVAQSEMIIRRTPLNPRVQRGLWFDETNPEPGMPVLRDGDKIYTPPKTEEYWAVWGEYQIKHSEWEELRSSVVAGKEGGKKEGGDRFKTIPRHYQTLKPKVTMYRCPRTKELKFFDWSVGKEPEILNAIEKGWSTENQMMSDGAVPLSVPVTKEMNGGTVSVQPFRIAGTGQVEMVSTPLSPMDRNKAVPSEGLSEALDALMGGTDIESKDFRVKDPETLRKYRDLKHVWEGYKKDAGKAFGKKEKFGPPRLAALQSGLMRENIPAEKKFIPFLVPAEMATELSTFWNKLDWIPFVNPGPGVGKDKFVLVPADRMVSFTWRNQYGTETEKRYCWSSLYKVAYDKHGMPVEKLTGKIPFTTIQYEEGAD